MTRKIILVAVNIRSTHNVGAFFRTADGFGADIMLVGETTPRPKGANNDTRLPHIREKAHSAIHKTALGAEKTVDWTYFKDYKSAFNDLKEKGYTICAIEQDKTSIPLQALPTDRDLALVVGPEVTGLDKNIIADCDFVYEIPMSGEKESFNVSVAAGIALYQSRHMINPL